MRLPKDVWNIVMQYKKDMELLSSNPIITNCFLSTQFGVPCFMSMELAAYIRHSYDFPFKILYDYEEARSVYRERLAIWGLLEAVPPPNLAQFPMLL